MGQRPSSRMARLLDAQLIKKGLQKGILLGNYSRFIRPGYHRIGLTLNEAQNFFGSAWASADGKEIVTVYSNLSEKAIRLGETHTGWNSEPKSIASYTTTGSKCLEEKIWDTDGQIYLEPESVTTIVYKL